MTPPLSCRGKTSPTGWPAAGANQEAINRAREFSAAARDTGQQFTAGARNEANQFGAGARNTAGQWNAGNLTDAAKWAAQQRADVNAGNVDIANNRMEINRAARERAGETNLGQRNSWLDRIASAAGGALGMGERGVGLGQQIQGATSADAGRMSGILQQLLGQSAGMFDSYTGQPFAGIERVLGALSGNPLSGTGTTTATSTPGLKTQLGTLAGGASRVGGGGK